MGFGRATAPRLSGVVELLNISLERDATRLEGLSGRIRFAGPDPWRTPGPQELRFSRLDFLGPVRDGTVRFEARGSELDLASFESSWAGGRIAARGRLDHCPD